jgi:hypothetical protein
MTAISLMPPVDYCPSCAGRKAQDQAADIGESRARKVEQHASLEASIQRQSDVAPAAEPGGTPPVSGASQTLLAPDLVVQATLAQSSIETGRGEIEAQRLRAAEAYSAS